MTRVTGETARQLLEGATPGPWEHQDGETGDEGPDCRYIYDGATGRMCIAIEENRKGSACNAAEIRLAAAAPELAETIAWLYGREAGEYGYQHLSEHEFVFAKPDGSVVYVDNDPDWEPKRYMSPDEAVDLARALLAAAEEASSDQ